MQRTEVALPSGSWECHVGDAFIKIIYPGGLRSVLVRAERILTGDQEEVDNASLAKYIEEHLMESIIPKGSRPTQLTAEARQTLWESWREMGEVLRQQGICLECGSQIPEGGQCHCTNDE